MVLNIKRKRLVQGIGNLDLDQIEKVCVFIATLQKS